MLNHLTGFERSLRVLEGLQASSVNAYCQKIKEFHTWLTGNDIPADPVGLTRKEIELYLEWCFYRGNSNQTRHTKLTALAKFFRYLKYEDIIREDVTANIPKPKITKRLMQAFSKDEILRLFSQIDHTTEKGIRDICILILAAFCGFRVSEIYNLNISDIIDDGKNIDFNVIDSKHGGSRIIYIWKSPGAFIRQYYIIRIGQSAGIHDPFLVSYVWRTAKGRRLTAGAIEILIKKLALKAGIKRPAIKTHMLRSSHANDLQSIKGYTLPAIQERMGWKDLSTAGRYLVRRERIHRTYNSLYEYWTEFNHIWKNKERNNANSSVGSASASPEPQGVIIAK